MEEVGVMLPEVGGGVSTVPPLNPTTLPVGVFPHGLRVLLLDDDAPARLELEAQLSACSYSVAPCCSAVEASTALHAAAQPPQLLLADTALLVSAGADAAALLGAAAVAGVPLLLMCSSATADDLTLGERLGCVGFLERPLSLLDVAQIWQYAAQPDDGPVEPTMLGSAAEFGEDDDGGGNDAEMMAGEGVDAQQQQQQQHCSPHSLDDLIMASPACQPFGVDLCLPHADAKPSFGVSTPALSDAKLPFSTDAPAGHRFAGDSRNHSQTNTGGCSNSFESCSMVIKMEPDEVDPLETSRFASGDGDGDNSSLPSLRVPPPTLAPGALRDDSFAGWQRHAAGVPAGLLDDFAAPSPQGAAGPALGLSAGQLPPLPPGEAGVVWGLPTNPLMFGMPPPPLAMPPSAMMAPPMMAMPPPMMGPMMHAPWGPACMMPVGPPRGPPCGPMHGPAVRMHPYMMPGRSFGVGPMGPPAAVGGTVASGGRAGTGGMVPCGGGAGPAAAGGTAAALAPGMMPTSPAVLSSRHAEDITALGLLPPCGTAMGEACAAGGGVGGGGSHSGSGTILSADMLVSALVQEDGDGRMPLGLQLKKSASFADLINSSLRKGFGTASA